MSEAQLPGGRSRVIFALDVPTKERAVALARILKDEVGLFKVGLELFVAEGPAVVRAVKDAAPECGIFLDLKFHDIPATVGRAVSSAVSLGADLLTVHSGGFAMLEAAVAAAGETKVLAVTVLTSQTKEDLAYTGVAGPYLEMDKQVALRAELAIKAGCAGCVCSPLEHGRVKRDFPELLAVTPGIRLAPDLGDDVCDDDQKRVATPYSAIKDGADYIVVGRPIRDAKDPKAAARLIAEEVSRGLVERGP